MTTGSTAPAGARTPDCDALRVAFAGTPEFAARILEALLGSRHRTVCVLAQPDRPAGRGRKLAPGPVAALARERGVPLHQPRTLKDPDAVAALAAHAPDVLVVAAYGLLLPPSVLALPPLGCLNVHGSLLPRWRGAAPIQRAILAGDAVTGIDVMQMDEGLDTGDVLLRREVAIGPATTAPELHDALAAAGAATIVEAVEGRCRGALVPRPQPGEGVAHAAKLAKAEAVLDFARPAVELDRAVRAYLPWPVAETRLDGERVRVWRARVAPDGASVDGPAAVDAAPGTVLAVTPDAVRAATGDGALELLELQRDGGKRMGAAAFAHGRELVGRRFGP